MNIPETLKQKIEIYDSWLEDGEDTWSDEEIKDESESPQKSINEIEDEFEDDFLRVMYPEWVENVEDWLQEREVLPEVKDGLEFVEKNGHVIWDEFLCDEDSIKFLEKYIQYAGKISEDIVETIKKIAQYLTEKCGLRQEELQVLEIRLNSDDYIGDYAWSQKQLEDIFEDVMIDNETFLEDMVEAKVLVHHQHWYRWLNMCLPECIRLNAEIVDEEKRIRYYQSIRKDLIKERTICGDPFLWEILYRVDKENFEKYILIPAASIIYKNVFEEKEGWLRNLIKCLEFQYDFEEDEIVGGTFCVNARIEIVEVYLEIDLFDNVSSAFSEENMEKLKRLGIISSGKTKLTLETIEEKGLMTELGIYAELKKFWNAICEWKEDI